MKNFIEKHGPVAGAIITVLLVVGAYAAESHWSKTQAAERAAKEISLKQKCATDGAAYYKNTILPQADPATILRDNQSSIQLYGVEAAKESGLIKTIVFSPEPEYSYNAKLNTCLIYYSSDSSMTTGSVVSNYEVVDVYTGKYVLSYFAVDGKPGNPGSSFDQFQQDRSQIME